LNLEAIKSAKNGDTDEIGNIILENMQSMYRVGFGILRNEDEIQEAISNTIVIVFEKIKTLKHEEFFKTWLIRILINECYKLYNHNKKIVNIEDYSNQRNLSYNDEYVDIEIRNLIKSLDEDLKEIVILYYLEDFSVKEISKIIKIPEGTVKSRLSRAREKLKGVLLENEIVEERRNDDGR